MSVTQRLCAYEGLGSDFSKLLMVHMAQPEPLSLQPVLVTDATTLPSGTSSRGEEAWVLLLKRILSSIGACCLLRAPGLWSLLAAGSPGRLEVVGCFYLQETAQSGRRVRGDG